MGKIFDFGLGLFKSPFDGRDILMESFLEPKITLPAKFSLKDKMTPIRNQGKKGSCAGHAGDMVKEYQEQINHKRFIRLSPEFIYDLARKESGHTSGTTLRAIANVLKKYGICEEKYCPYTEVQQDASSITKEAYENALNYRIRTYARIKNLEELKQTIYQLYPAGGATMIGIYLFKGVKSEQSKETGAIPNPSCFDRFKPIGGHAITADGWNDNSPFYKRDGHIESAGSWGEEFGGEGYHYVSYAYIEKHLVDAVAFVDIETPLTFVKRINDLSISETKKAWV